MAIRKQVQWDRKTSKFIGHVDYGRIKAEEIDTKAKNALLIVACGLQKPWFVPVGYFLTNSPNGGVLKQLVFEAINRLTEIEAVVHAVVFYGAPKNLSMTAKFGCNIKNLHGAFDHPSIKGRKIYAILDICHLLKLARNALADMKTFLYPKRAKIYWDFIQALYRLQQKDFLHLGNKLKTNTFKGKIIK